MRVRSSHGYLRWHPPHHHRRRDPGAPAALTVDALACARLARLTVTDTITAPVRDRVVAWANRHRDWTNPGPDPFLVGLLACEWCASVWWGVGIVAARRVAPRYWHPVACALAFSEVAGLASTHGYAHSD